MQGKTKKGTVSKIAEAEHCLKELERTFAPLKLRETHFLSMGHQTFILQPIKSTLGVVSSFDVHYRKPGQSINK